MYGKIGDQATLVGEAAEAGIQAKAAFVFGAAVRQPLSVR
jgi:hypothetical protein